MCMCVCVCVCVQGMENPTLTFVTPTLLAGDRYAHTHTHTHTHTHKRETQVILHLSKMVYGYWQKGFLAPTKSHMPGKLF